MNNYQLIKGVVGLQTTERDLRWSYGIRAPEVPVEHIEDCKIVLKALVLPETDITPPSVNERGGRYHHYFTDSDNGRLWYQRRLAPGADLRMWVTVEGNREVTVAVNRAYYKLVSMRIMNLHSLGYILTDFTNLQLSRSGYAPLHCSAFQVNGETVVVFAPPNIGKTLTTMEACTRYGAKFLSEDLAITDGEMIFGVPWTSTFRYYDTLNTSVRARTFARLRNVVPILDLFSGGTPERITEYVSPESIVDSGKADRMFILERGSKGLRRINEIEAYRKIDNLNRFEFKYAASPTVTAYEYFNEDLDIRRAQEKEESAVRSLVDNTEVYTVTAEKATDYIEMIMNSLD